MKVSINIEIPTWVWFMLHLCIVVFVWITFIVLDTRGLIPWSTFTIVQEILAIFVSIIIFGGGIIGLMVHFFEVTY